MLVLFETWFHSNMIYLPYVVEIVFPEIVYKMAPRVTPYESVNRFFLMESAIKFDIVVTCALKGFCHSFTYKVHLPLSDSFDPLVKSLSDFISPVTLRVKRNAFMEIFYGFDYDDFWTKLHHEFNIMLYHKPRFPDWINIKLEE